MKIYYTNRQTKSTYQIYYTKIIYYTLEYIKDEDLLQEDTDKEHILDTWTQPSNLMAFTASIGYPYKGITFEKMTNRGSSWLHIQPFKGYVFWTPS